MVKQCTILFGCLALGDFVVWATGVKLPGSIIGMLLLTAFLQMGWVKLRWVKGISDFLVSNMGFFFVPPGVALMLYFDVIAAEFWPIFYGHGGQYGIGSSCHGARASMGKKTWSI